MSEAKLFLGVDSGFSHVANALDIRSIFLLGKFRTFKTYKPWRLASHDFILRTETSAASITAEEVIEAIKGALVDVRDDALSSTIEPRS